MDIMDQQNYGLHLALALKSLRKYYMVVGSTRP
jgi:hypothetical protein